MKKVKNHNGAIIASMLVFAFVLGVVGFASKAKADEDFRSIVLEKLVAKIPSEKAQELLAKALGVSEDEQLGLSTISVSATGLTNVRVGGLIQRGSSSSTYIYRVSQYDVEVWPAGTTTLRFQNSRSTTSTVERVIFDMTGTRAQTASSTFMISCGRSPTGFVAFDSTSPPLEVWNRVIIPTSSQFVLDSFQVNSSTASSDGAATNLSATSPGSRGSILIGPNVYLTCVAQVPAIASNVCDSGGVQCEAVTSTNRGWIANMTVVWGWTEGL